MSYSTYLTLTMATLILTPGRTGDDSAADPPDGDLDEALQPAVDAVYQLLERFRRGPVSPVLTAQFEKDVRDALRHVGRVAVEWTYNHVEPAAVAELPRQVDFEGTSFASVGRKTPHEVSTLFGPIRLYRLGYRARPDVGERMVFPLCRELGVVCGASPALVERVAHYAAQGGATQQETLRRLRDEHALTWGVKRLRQVFEFVAGAMEEQRPKAQVEQVLSWLAQAEESRGRNRPVLGVGRDGITLHLRIKGGAIYEVASTGTLSVYDRRRRRLGTVYLAYPPESGQETMSRQLTELVVEVLRRWPGPVPRLSYVTDAGDNETAYYRKVLRRLRHPRSGQRLHWFWVVDYYHAAERLWTMAEALFGVGHKSWAWARKMQKLLLKPSGLSRVLHSAAAWRLRMKLKGTRLGEFRKAYQYLQVRRKHVRYADYRRLGLPIGSGVTEAACKTVYTQRLKLSGMHWKKAGAQTILRLRVILLSGVWESVYQGILEGYSRVEVEAPGRVAVGTKAKPA